MLSPRGAAKDGPLVVAGIDIAAWELVEIADVPQVRWGIHLDARHADAAVLDHYPALANNATMGPIERDGRVVAGSVLVSVNEYDFLEHRLTLQEIGRVLRDTSHLSRTVRFRVPPSSGSATSKAPGDPADDTSSAKTEIEKRVLLSGTISSSTKTLDVSSPSKKTWTFKGLLSPSAASSSSSPPSTPASPTEGDSSANAPVAPTAGESLTASATTSSPTAAALRSPTRTTANDRRIVAKVPPGPLGLNLDGAVPQRAVVLGFLPLPDGSSGVLEQRGDIASGSTLVAINGMSVAHLSLDEARTRLGALAGLERELVFELPDPNAHLRSSNQVSNEAMDQRRKAELALVLRHDKRKLSRKECWFLVSTEWLERWVAFTTPRRSRAWTDLERLAAGARLEGATERRGGRTTRRHETRARAHEGLSRRRAHGLEPARRASWRRQHPDSRQVRAVEHCPQLRVPVCLTVHGSSGGNRYSLDADGEPVSETEINAFLREPRLRAMTLVQELHDRLPAAFP
ncbi:hypothetical protein PINS_up016967 [Pythium insidiosum]|nr:hypothetical protein PINS_up016967 [Pythium insidiosum]